MDHLRVILELAVAQTGFRSAYVYRFHSDDDEADLIATIGIRINDRQNRSGLRAHRDRNAPIVLHSAAWRDPRFAALPEFRVHQFDAAVSVPLLDSGAVLGLVNFCRKEAGPLKPREVALLIELGLPLSILVAAASLREQPTRTERGRADRTVLERAKGLLQERLDYTEEQAYLHLWLLSRQRRTPIREIAERLLQGDGMRAEASH